MLNRQRVVIEMLRQMERPVSKLELMKWCFLLKKETASRGGPAFYEFVPHRHGPHSFCLEQELGTLADRGILEVKGEVWEWVGGPSEDDKPADLVANDIGRVVERIRERPVNEVLDGVRDQQTPRPAVPLAIYTAGYEGLLVDGFLNMLVQNGIGRLIDVRSNPVSRHYGFHKSTLGRLCGELEIEYQHVPELGIPSALRQALESPTEREALFDRYETEMLPGESEAIERVASMITERPSVLVCKEADARMCHRSRLARAVRERIGLSVVDLMPGGAGTKE
jgi:Protein of unknown function, DUF488